MLDRIANAIEAQKPDRGDGAKSWWRWPLLIMLILAGLAVAAWVATRNARELARLRHEKFKRNQLARQAAVDAQVASNNTKRDRALAEVEKQNEKLLEAKLRLHAAERRHEFNRESIRRLTWASLPRGD